MSAEPDRAARRRYDGFSTVGLFAALTTALLPLLGVVVPGLWLPLSLLVFGVVLTAGYLARRLSAPAVAVTLLETVLWVALVTGIFFADAALLAVIPTPDALERVPPLLEAAANDIAVGVAPLEAGAALTFLIVGSVGLLAIALDHVVLTARMPLLASVALIAVWLIPTLAVPRDVNLWAFILLAATILWLIRAETRSRVPRAAGSPAAGIGAVSAVIATVAIVVSVVAAPTIPRPVASGGGIGGTAINANLDLGDDLRRPTEVPVLRLWGDAPSPPYLRVATLTGMDGESWRPDREVPVPLGDGGITPPPVGEDVRVVEYTTGVQVLDLASSWLPVPYPAVSIEGLEGSWEALPGNGTVRSSEVAAGGQEYTVVTRVARPTIERARDAGVVTDDLDLLRVPVATPDNVAELAAEVTAEAGNDYDRLLALQSWFRGNEFDYSLEAPVEEGFDGSGVEAVSRFLDVRAGYCVHFASAFALMARTLDMPSRVVVGFLPGVSTDEEVDGDRVYEATTAQLHAWPEVLFDGIGWVAFEPTKSLGSAQRFLSGDAPESDENPTPTPTTTPSASASSGAAEREQEDDIAAGAASSGPGFDDFAPFLAVVGGVLLILATPGLLRRGREATLQRRARQGDVGAVWRLVQDAAIDVGIAVPGAESPRAFGARLVRRGAPEAQMGRLVSAVEHASYAAPGRRPTVATDALVTDAAAIRRALLVRARPNDRTLALRLPRSLIVRPGSTFAEAAPAEA
ncbi:transglutaminaseTgpA domain-containing protein [Microbacterium sp. 179-B 1A2 NHS]|uniref:transglutaminase family protein n=1 Tax=Microbacterium sp. 179-B 1A2 NHS TaxID=3142383 RepID=UPI0039A19B00